MSAPDGEIPTEQPEQVFVYVDETKLDLPGGQHVLGAGALIVTSRVSDSLVVRAMDRLRTDPDRDPNAPRFNANVEKLDRKTIARGHFHASLDSMNGHSHLASEIKAGVRGRFMCSFAELGTSSEEAEFRSHAISSILPAVKVRCPIELVFEQRSSFSRWVAKALIDHMYQGIDWSTYDGTMIPSYYPATTATVRSKCEPGLQVADLLLWASVQKKYHPGTKRAAIGAWCGLHCWAESGFEGEPVRWISCDLNGDDPKLIGPDRIWLKSYPVKFDDVDRIDNTQLAHLYCLAERVVRGCAVGTLPAHAEHLRPGLARAVARLRNADRVGSNEIQDVARQFIRLFDTVPLYDGLQDGDTTWVRLVQARRFLGLCLREDLIHGGRTLDYFLHVRRNNAQASPSAFGITEKA
jgi:hypothetical protein